MVNVKILVCQMDMPWLFYKETIAGAPTTSLGTPLRCLTVMRIVLDFLTKNVLVWDTMGTS